MLHHLWASLAATVILLVICCGIYPLIVWGLAQAIFPNQANGSLVKKDGTYTTKDSEAVGSSLLGQNFSAAQYFHPRPSSAGAGYDAANSSGSNLGPLSDKLLNGLVNTDDKSVKSLGYDGVRLRTLHYAIDNGITFKTTQPLDGFKDKDGNLDDIKLVEAFPHAGDPADKKPLELTDFSTPIPADAVTASGSGLDPHISVVNASLQKARVAKARGISEADLQKLIDHHTDGPDLGILGDAGVNVLMLNLALDQKYPPPVAAATTQQAK
jgi:K+-transporting ATPase ATPase C chain